MTKNLTSALLLIFLIVSCIVIANPVLGTQTENSWVEKAPMNVARGDLGVAVVNEKIYAIGGSTKTGSSSSTGSVVGVNEEYDPATEMWEFKASMPTPRYSFAIVACQNKIYCVGGYTANGSYTGANEVYEPASNTWETKAPMPTLRSELEANVVNGKIYLMGGLVSNNTSPSRFSISSLNEIYDPATDSWNTGVPLPFATHDYASTVSANKIYLIGGYSQSPKSNLNQIYDAEKNYWSQGAPSPSGIRDGGAVATSGVNATKRIYAIGRTWNLWEGEPSYSVRVYDQDNDSWTFGNNIPSERENFGTAIVNDRIYVIGGQTYYYPDVQSESTGPYVTPHATNEQYTPFGYGSMPTASLSSTTTISESSKPSIPELSLWIIPILLIAIACTSIILYRKKRLEKL